MSVCITKRGVAGVLLLAMLLMTVSVVRAEEISIAGEYYSEDYILQPLKEPFKGATGITLSVRLLLFPLAFRELMAQTLDGFVNSLPDEEILQDLKKKVAEVDTALIRSAIIAKIPVSVVVANKNPVAKLSKDELKAIFTGKVKFWNEVGGGGEKIRVVRPWAAPVRSALRYQVMDGEKYTSELIHPLSWKESRQAVAETPGLITVLPTALVDGSVKVLDTPEVAQFVTVLTKGEPSEKVKQFIDFARKDGQKYIDTLREPKRRKR